MKQHTQRNKVEIMRDILELCNARISMTNLSYQMRMNYVVLKRNLEKLLNAGLIDRDGAGLLLITDRGREFLQICDQYNEYLGVYKPKIMNF